MDFAKSSPMALADAQQAVFFAGMISLPDSRESAGAGMSNGSASAYLTDQPTCSNTLGRTGYGDAAPLHH